MLPWLGKRFQLRESTAAYFDLTSSSHRVQLGQALVRRATWLGVAMSLAFLCGAVILATILINSNSPVTEYWLNFREGTQNPQNLITFTLTPWIHVNDIDARSKCLFLHNISLIDIPDSPGHTSSCSKPITWQMDSDARLAFSFPVAIQTVSTQTSK